MNRQTTASVQFQPALRTVKIWWKSAWREKNQRLFKQDSSSSDILTVFLNVSSKDMLRNRVKINYRTSYISLIRRRLVALPLNWPNFHFIFWLCCSFFKIKLRLIGTQKPGQFSRVCTTKDWEKKSERKVTWCDDPIRSNVLLRHFFIFYLLITRESGDFQNRFFLLCFSTFRLLCFPVGRFSHRLIRH